jgi:hypothetical protein
MTIFPLLGIIYLAIQNCNIYVREMVISIVKVCEFKLQLFFKMKLIGKMWQIRVAKLGDKLFAI